MGLPFDLLCPFHAMTGLYCPLCGLMRAFAALWRLDVPAAFGYNPLVMLALPVIACMAARWALDRYCGKSLPVPPLPHWAPPALALAVAVFWLARNIPVYPLTILAP